MPKSTSTRYVITSAEDDGWVVEKTEDEKPPPKVFAFESSESMITWLEEEVT